MPGQATLPSGWGDPSVNGAKENKDSNYKFLAIFNGLAHSLCLDVLCCHLNLAVTKRPQQCTLVLNSPLIARFHNNSSMAFSNHAPPDMKEEGDDEGGRTNLRNADFRSMLMTPRDPSAVGAETPARRGPGG